MLDLARLQKIRLRPRPVFQRVVAYLLLVPNYAMSRTRIVLEGAEHIPRGGGAILVMNHTDRYNYWPLQLELWRRGLGYTATWVKGKYYEHPLIARFMDAGNNIPIPSKGYVLTKDFQRLHRRLPTEAEYEALRGAMDGRRSAEEAAQAGAAVQALLAQAEGGYLDGLEGRFSAMMARVVEINREALEMGLHLLIFPQGTRSIRLTRGHPGAAQIALATGAKVVPVGCNGSDRCYPGNAPWSRGGTIVYRVGAPLSAADALAPYVPDTPFVPFTRTADPHLPRFQAATDLLMDRINGLLDPPYRFGGADKNGRSASRFV